ncbi:MAG: ribulose-phosphate 3-epimerase [Candidatus Omnitrophota bacterium]
MIKIAPSILSADFSCLGKEIKKVEQAGADLIHVDIMDGHFVPNITIGPAVVKDIRRHTKLPLDVHLMIKCPWNFVAKFVDAGSDMITVHVETITAGRFKALAKNLKNRRIRVGISLNPATPMAKLIPVLKFCDFVLVMSVNPGFGGQDFMLQALPKIKQLRRVFKKDISVDGGINEKTAGLVISAGANILAAGSYIFKSKNYREAIGRLRCAK